MSVLSIFSKIFPTPRYLKLENTGVDISDTSLKYVQFERSKKSSKSLVLKSWGDVDISPGVIERGHVQDIKGLTDALVEAKEKCGMEYVRVSLPEERAYVFETKLKSSTPFKEIRGMLESKLQENVPISPKEAFFDFDIVEYDKEAKEWRVSVIVYAQDTIISYYRACTDAKLIPLSFEVEAQAMSRSVIPKGVDGAYMVVDFGKTRTGISIIHKDTLMYASTLDVGGQYLSALMRQEFGDLPEKELTRIKNTQGILHTTGNEKLLKILMKPISTIKDDIEIRMQYWHTRDVEKRKRGIQKIILAGGSCNLAGLPEYLSTTLGIEVERAQVWQNAYSFINEVPPITQRYSYGYTTAIGLALKNFMDT